MTTPACPSYAGYRFPAEIISHAVWLYFRFPLSLRMVDELLGARGILVSHESVRQWALKFGQGFTNQIRRRLPAAGDKWHLDEVVLTISGVKHWLWRAVDQNGMRLCGNTSETGTQTQPNLAASLCYDVWKRSRSMTRYIEGWNRSQSFLLPECVDDYVDEDNLVRVVDAFVDELDLARLGFERAVPAVTGRPAYHPAVMLKLYVYGYLNRIASSRRLEREAQRNIELVWLTGRLAPDFKTIADFRRDNGPAIRAACRQFVVLCRELGLFADALVAIDGSKFKAVNTRDKNYTEGAIKRRLEQVEASISRYMAALDTADRQDPDVAPAKVERLKERLVRLREQMRHLREMEAAIKAAPDGQISLTDPDARSMATSGKGTGIVGYNVQVAVDIKHHLIVAHDVTNAGSDRGQLAVMARLAQEATDRRDLTVLADRGYFSGWEIYACEQGGVVPYVPKPLTSGAKFEGRFGKQDFVYLPGQDAYRCPAGETLAWRFNSDEGGDKMLRHYWTTKCPDCAIKAQCTPGKQRRVKRWEHEGMLDAMQKRLDQVPQAMVLRRQTVEHPFGTIKAWMGATHFLTKRLKRVRTEMSLQVLAYNMKRVVTILGAKPLMEAIKT